MAKQNWFPKKESDRRSLLSIFTSKSPLSWLFLLLLLLSGLELRGQGNEEQPNVTILTYTNLHYRFLQATQDWVYADGKYSGYGAIREHNKTEFHRYLGGFRTNYQYWTSSGQGGQNYGWWNYSTSTESSDSALWQWSSLPGIAWTTTSVSNYWTYDGLTTPYVWTDQTQGLDTNFWYEPWEARSSLFAEVVPWTMLYHLGAPHTGYFEKWTNYNWTDTTLEVFSGGVTNSTEDVTVQLQVWAYDHVQNRYLAANEFSVNGRAPDTNGNVYFLMQDNQRLSLSFSCTPFSTMGPGSMNGTDYSFWAYPTRHHHFAAVDRNGDGQIEFTGTNDLTAQNLRYLFWVNNDWETFKQSTLVTGELYYEFDDAQITSSGGTDFHLDYIHNERDLEDFARLHIQVPIPFTGTNWGVRIKGGDLKFFGGTDGTQNYLTDTNVATSLVGTNGTEFLGRTGSGPVWIPGDRFNSEQNLHLLFEAGQTGDVTLEVELVWHGQVVGNSRVWLKLMDVKSMYDQWVVGDLANASPSTDYIPAFTASHAGAIHPDVLAQLTGATNYILFVHGWNMLKWEKEAFAETAFKRLWWQGYRGRYGAFRWPTYHMGLANVYSTLVNYDCSEYNSWKSATALEGLLVYLNDPSHCTGNVRVMAHSMGNVVTGEALRRLRNFRLPGTDQPYVRNYLALQGAIPAHAYDGSENHNIDFLPYVPDNLTPNRYAMYWRDTNGPYFDSSGGAGTYRNYTNTNDYALKKWLIDQQTKPDESLGYSYSATAAAANPQNSGIRRGVLLWMRELFWPTGEIDLADTHEAFAFGIEARSSALGASVQVQGLFGGNELPLHGDPSDPSGTFLFGRTHDYHSKQFRSTIALQWEFWKRVRADFELD